MKRIILSLVSLLIFTSLLSQNTVTGSFTNLAKAQIKLMGYNGFDTYLIDSTQANEKGSFLLSFDIENYGMAYLLSGNNNRTPIILAENENLQLTGFNFAKQESIKIVQGEENKLFSQYINLYQRKEKCLNAWNYLAKIYKDDTLFSVHKAPKQNIEIEKNRIKKEDSLFLATLPADSYVQYYLPLYKLLSSISTISQYRTEEIPATINSFRRLDYTDPNLYKSGLIKDIIESHFWLIENSGIHLDSVYTEMKISIEHIIESLILEEQKLNEITEYLFHFLEQRSLFSASEYLALKLLNEKQCSITNDFASQLEGYRAMKKGNTAPEIFFSRDTDILISGDSPSSKLKKLSEIVSNYKVIIFGASWCPQCPKDLKEISTYYVTWKQQGVEVIFVSLDEEKQTFTNFTKPFSFISTCDYKKWEGKAAKDYHIFATPTVYLLDKEHEIILRPNSIKQLNSWIDRYLVKKSK